MYHSLGLEVVRPELIRQIIRDRSIKKTTLKHRTSRRIGHRIVVQYTYNYMTALIRFHE